MSLVSESTVQFLGLVIWITADVLPCDRQMLILQPTRLPKMENLSLTAYSSFHILQTR